MCELWFYWGKFVCGSRASHGRAGDGFKRWDCAQWSFFFFFLPLLPAWSLHFTSGSLLHSSCWLSVKTAQKYWIIALLCFNCFLERSMYHVAYTHVSWELAKAALQMSFCVYSAIYGEANDRKCKSWHFHISNGKPPPPFSVSTCSPSWYLFYSFFCKTVMGVSISTQRVSLSVTFFLLLLCLLTTICNFLSEYPLADRRYITVQPSPHDLGINASLNAWPTHKELIVSLIIYSQQRPTVAASSSHTRSPNKGKIIKPSLLCDYGLKDSTAIPKTS